jgi:hypothetical protein
LCLREKFRQGFRARSVGVELIWQGPSVALQVTRGPEGLSKFIGSTMGRPESMRWRQLTGLRSNPNDNQTAIKTEWSADDDDEIGWKGPSLRGGGSRQSNSADLLLMLVETFEALGGRR